MRSDETGKEFHISSVFLPFVQRNYHYKWSQEQLNFNIRLSNISPFQDSSWQCQSSGCPCCEWLPSPWVGLVLIILQLWCSQRHHRCQLSSPPWLCCGQCVMSPVPGADTDHRSAQLRGVFAHLYSISVHWKSFIWKLPNVITIADARLELQVCRGDEHLSIRVASAGVRCLEILRQFLLRGGWFIVTSWEGFTDQWGRSKDRHWPIRGEQEKLAASRQLRVSLKWGVAECGDRQQAALCPCYSHSFS